MRSTEVSARWSGEQLNFVGTDSRGHEITMGKENITPGQMLLLGLAGCTGMDVVSILQKKRQNITSVEVQVTAQQQDDYPKPYQDIQLKFIIKGEGIDAKSVGRSIDLSTHKYCVVGQTIERETHITTSFEVQEA